MLFHASFLFTLLKNWILRVNMAKVSKNEFHSFGVHVFRPQNNVTNNLLTPMSSKMSMSFFLQSKRN